MHGPGGGAASEAGACASTRRDPRIAEDLQRRSFSLLETGRDDRDDDQHRPPHPARGVPAPARRRHCQLPPRVGRARPARADSWMGAGSRLVTFEEAEELELPVVGYLAYDHVARLEPTVPLPDDGRGFPESRLDRRRDARPLRPRRRRRRGARGRPRRDRRPPRGRHPVAARGARHAGAAAPLPGARALRGDGALGQGAHRRRRRLPVRPVAARRAADVGDAARRLPRAAPRQSVAVPVPARARRRSRSSARRPSGSSRARTDARASARSPARPSPPRETSSGCSPRRRTAPST